MGGLTWWQGSACPPRRPVSRRCARRRRSTRQLGPPLAFLPCARLRSSTSLSRCACMRSRSATWLRLSQLPRHAHAAHPRPSARPQQRVCKPCHNRQPSPPPQRRACEAAARHPGPPACAQRSCRGRQQYGGVCVCVCVCVFGAVSSGEQGGCRPVEAVEVSVMGNERSADVLQLVQLRLLTVLAQGAGPRPAQHLPRHGHARRAHDTPSTPTGNGSIGRGELFARTVAQHGSCGTRVRGTAGRARGAFFLR